MRNLSRSAFSLFDKGFGAADVARRLAIGLALAERLHGDWERSRSASGDPEPAKSDGRGVA